MSVQAPKSPERPPKRSTGEREQERIIKNRHAGVPARHGASWSPEEDERLGAMFQRGDAIAVIAGAHQRKTGAIISRLIKLGLITEDGVIVTAAEDG